MKIIKMRIESDWKENSPADNQFPATCPRPRKNVCEGGAKVAGKKWKESMLAVGEREGKARLSTTASNGKTFGRKEDAHRLSRTLLSSAMENIFFRPSRGTCYGRFRWRQVPFLTWAGTWNRVALQNFAAATGLPAASFLGRPSRKLR